MSNETPQPRQDRAFLAWLTHRGLSRRWVMDLLGVSGPRASVIIHSMLARPDQVEKLRAAGVPSDVLPRASRGTTGPIPKAASEQQVAA